MNSDSKYMILGIGASLTAAYWAYKMWSSKKQSKKQKKAAKRRVVDVDSSSENGLSDIDITIINGDNNDTIDKFTETSVPLSRINYHKQKKVEMDSATFTSSTDHVMEKKPVDILRDLSVDSEDEKFKQWQAMRERQANGKSYIKNDKVYCEGDSSTKDNDHEFEKKKLNTLITDYAKTKIRKRSGSLNKEFKPRKLRSDFNRSTSDLWKSERESWINENSVDSRPDSLVNMVKQKREDNFFEILALISKPLVEEKCKNYKLPIKIKKRKKIHLNANSEPSLTR